ncbi:WD40 domain-containing protein [Encephalitozoon hellem ATCC 50504]|uniref:Coatomer subunit beta n=1 Tax=Encephalitozoon hellem TaxID=27973 RepID=A0A9Q9CDD7_ENCHE|nr:WD40 domain-containing protein [Encephalitozoon hellem ATCC 50504]AFM98825.1 WD40 domain-containing protein [Encephalitozoon hellem ATCC 50504]UTX43803.1 coatomer subunit beta' [Encephalitozoon hellem]|eukprot:XP_003887806.1 WD40 domain-containing protein [Encephalitozoon hellem ATCC 50504]
MKFKRTIQKTFGSSKVKSIQMHPTKAMAIIGLFSGSVQIWDTEKMCMLNDIHVSNEPIRTCMILSKMDWLLVGSDDGNVSVYELGKYRKIKTLHAHDDFIRKIEGHPQDSLFLTASDDATMKMWAYEGEISQKMVYTGHTHFVMDVCFYPNDSSKFVSCSLDSTIKVWNVGQAHCIKTFKGHTSGINSICFLSGDYLVSGADDLMLKVWDFQTTQCITTLSGHTNNINKVYPLAGFPLFASCGEDGSVRLWNNKTFKQEDLLMLQGGRVWDVKEKNGKMVVGCDEELIFIDAHQGTSLVRMSRSRIFYSVSGSIFGAKSGNIGVVKELCNVGFYPDELEVSPSGKTIAVGNEGEFQIFSSLGFRNKFNGEGRDFHFISDDEFIVRNGDEVRFYKKTEVTGVIEIKGISKLFFLSTALIGCNVCDQTRIYSSSGEFILSIDDASDHLVMVGDFLVACGALIRIYRVNHEVINGFIEQEIEVPEEGITDALTHVGTEYYSVSSWCTGDGIFYFVSNNKGYYLILGDRLYVHHFSPIDGIAAGVEDGTLFYLHGKDIESKKIDMEFLEFQRSVILGKEYRITEGIRSKAIAFFESLEMHERALDLCNDDNQKFEILLKLDRYDEAFSKANSIVKYDKLGRYFLKAGELSKASECFLRSKNWESLLLADILSGKRNLSVAGTECRKEGRLNHAFFAYLKGGQYGECAKLLEGTPFSSLFCKNYLD